MTKVLTEDEESMVALHGVIVAMAMAVVVATTPFVCGYKRFPRRLDFRGSLR